MDRTQMDRQTLIDNQNRSLREVNLSLKNGINSNKNSNSTQQSPMFFSEKRHTKTMIRTEFFLINRNADPTFLFSALLHEIPCFNSVFTVNDQVYQVKDLTRTLIPGRDPEKVREGDVKVLVIPKRVYARES